MRTVENAKRNETYGTDTGQIRNDSDIKRKRIVQKIHRHSEWAAVGTETTKRLDGVRLFHFLSLHGVGLTIAKDENLTIFYHLCTLYFVTLYILYAFRIIGVERNSGFLNSISAIIFCGKSQVVACTAIQTGNTEGETCALCLCRYTITRWCVESNRGQLTIGIEDKRANDVSIFVFDNQFVSCRTINGRPNNIGFVFRRSNNDRWLCV